MTRPQLARNLLIRQYVKISEDRLTAHQRQSGTQDRQDARLASTLFPEKQLDTGEGRKEEWTQA